MTSGLPSSRPLLQVEHVKKSFGGNYVLRDISFTLLQGSVTALIGSNGAGKSTFLNILSGLLPADDGVIRLKEQEITSTPSYARARCGLGRTFQHPRSFKSLTARQSVTFATTTARDERIGRSVLRRLFGALRKDDRVEAVVEKNLARCLLLHKADVVAAELSYGEQKLLMLAQALVCKSDFLCLDELCAGLEPAVVDHVGDLVLALAHDGKTILFVEHNLELVRKIAGNAVFLHEGHVFRSGPTDEILADPEVIRLYLGN
jgi:ABC-type branched-subunit amino acid transport system ATPase component